MHRFFVTERIEGIGAEVTLSKEESVHAARVLRLKAGEPVALLDGEGLYAGILTHVSEQGTRACIAEALPSPEPDMQVTLVQGLPKADKLEMIVQKATELGAWAITPVEMARCVAKADKQGKKRERYQRIALEAAKQSGRAHVPEVGETVNFAGFCRKAEANAFDVVFVAWEEEHALPLSKALCALQEAGKPLQRIAVVIGPEGGITAEECERLKALGAVSVTLGRRILRTETAGLCALSVIWAACGEM